jgi:hypothetical protein
MRAPPLASDVASRRRTGGNHAESCASRLPLAGIGVTLLAHTLGLNVPGLGAQACTTPYQVPREEILQAMSGHGAYSLTTTTTSTLFGAEALLAIVRRRQQQSPGSTDLLIAQTDWFAAHLATAGVAYADMSEAARAGFEHHQDILVEYGPQVVDQVVEGSMPIMSLDVTLSWPDSEGAPSDFSYKDTLSVPRVDVYNDRVIRVKLLEYDDMLVFDQVTGISVRPMGFLSGLFAVLGKPDLKQTRIGVTADQWQVMRGQVKVFPGISKTATATIEPGGRGHENIPSGRPDLAALEERIKRPVKLQYGTPSCQARLRMLRRSGTGGGGHQSGIGTAEGAR